MHMWGMYTENRLHVSLDAMASLWLHQWMELIKETKQPNEESQYNKH